MRREQSNKELLKQLDELVEGHNDAKKALIVMLNRSVLRTHQKFIKYMYDEYLVSPMKVLLIGRSGSGKTHLVESLQRIAMFPLIKIDATELNPTGASGGVKAEKLKKMIFDNAKEYYNAYPASFGSVVEAVERSVVFIDEIDKIGLSFDSGGNWNKHTQSNFLTIFDNKEEFSGVSFVFAGAFTDITNKKEDKKNSIGFNASKQDDIEPTPLDELIISCGLIPELVGRMNAIVELDLFTKEQMLTILEKRIIPKKLIDLAAYGSNIPVDIVSQEMKEEIVEKAANNGQGVRHLQREVDRIFMDAEFNTDVCMPMLENMKW